MAGALPLRSLPRVDAGKSCYFDARRTAHCAKRGEHIVFMGDSLTRYQWVALAMSFHRGYELSSTEFPSSVIEREWRHWTQFYNGSNARLEPTTRCDCHRSYARPVGSKTIENRYYWTADGALNLTYIAVLDPSSLIGSWMPKPPLDRDALRHGVHPTFDPKWRLNWTAAIAQVVAPLRPPPTVLVLNTGQWGEMPYEAARELRAAAEAAAPRVLWKTTTRMRKAGPTKWQRTDLHARRAFDEVYDAAFLTRALDRERDYWDARHYLPHVYNDLNAALLAQLYGPPLRCAGFNHGACTEPEPDSSRAVGPPEGWRGVLARPPAQWSVVQALMWMDALDGVQFDVAAFTHAQLNGSGLLRLASPDPTRLAEVGVKRPKEQARVARRLQAAVRGRRVV